MFHGAIPDLVLWAVILGWVVTQIITTGGAIYLLRDAEEKRQSVVKHFDTKLKDLKEDLGAPEVIESNIKEHLDGLQVRIVDIEKGWNVRLDELKIDERISEVRDDVREFWTGFSDFAEKMGKDVESLPKRLQMGAIGAQGNEVVALQAYLEKQEGAELDPSMSMMEAVASEDPELIVAMALQKVAALSPSEKWVGEHPWGAAAWEIGKPAILAKMAEFAGVAGAGPAARKLKGKGGSIYG